MGAKQEGKSTDCSDNQTEHPAEPLDALDGVECRFGVADRTTVDRDALAAYCQVYARWKEAEEYLARHGEVYPLRDDRGKIRYMQQFPQVAIARQLLQTLRAYQQEFGLTPSARSQVVSTVSATTRWLPGSS